MATLSYDFESDPLWSQPDGWSVFESGTGTVYSRVNAGRYEIGGSSWNHAECDDVTSSVGDVLVSGTNCAAPFGGHLMVFARSDDQYLGSWTTYRIYVSSNGTGSRYLTMDKYINGTRTQLGQTTASIYYSYAINFKFEATGSTVRSKIWRYGTSEPGWLLSATDTSISSGGVRVGGQGGQALFDNLSIESDDISIDVDVDQDPVGEIDVTGYDPSVLVGVNVTPGGLGGEIKIAHYDPIAKLSVHTTPGAGAVGITGYDPELGFPVNAAPAGSVTITGYNPTVAASASEVHLYFKFKDTAGNVWTREIDAKPPVVEVTTTYIASSVEEVIWADASGGAFNITLPTVTGRNGFTYEIKKTDSSANAVTIVGTIDGDANFDLEFQHESVTLKAGDSDWGIM